MTNSSKILIGPFQQLLTARNFPLRGPISDTALEVLEQVGILIQGDRILDIDNYDRLATEAKLNKYTLYPVEEPLTVLPGLIDCHTHIAWHHESPEKLHLNPPSEIEHLSSSLRDCVLEVVQATREATDYELVNTIKERLKTQLQEGVTTCEVKSGYGLDVRDELSILEAINLANWQHDMDVIPTCMAAYMLSPEFTDASTYLDQLANSLLPKLLSTGYANRIDIWVDDMGFSQKDAHNYIQAAKELGLKIHIHAGTVDVGDCVLATEVGAKAVAHLENISEAQINNLAQSDVIAILLPQASQGLGQKMASARQLLDAGASVAVATDWNPVYAPAGRLLYQAALLKQDQGMSTAETLASITTRAAEALGLNNRGILDQHKMADFIAFPTANYQDLFDPEKTVRPSQVWKRGKLLNFSEEA